MKIRINKKLITPHSSLILFVVGLFMLPIYIDLMGTLSLAVGFNTKVTTYIYYGSLWILLIIAMPQIRKALTRNVFLGAFIFLLFVAYQLLFYPLNHKYILFPPVMDLVLFSPSTLLSVFPYILIGIAVKDIKTLLKYLHTGARIGVVCGALSYILAIAGGHEILYDDMANAYALCVMVCILVTNYQKNDVYFFIIGCFCLLLAGTRGPLLCVAVAMMIRIVFLEANTPKKYLKICIIILAVIFLRSNLLNVLVDLISDGFAAIGVTNLRIIDYFREGMLTDSSGRDAISSIIKEKIIEDPLFGYGPGGDRVVLMSELYAHNLPLEIWVSYGVVFGTLILCWMGYLFFRSMAGRDKVCAAVVAALFSGVVMKLFFSSSYLYSKELFLVLGICLANRTMAKRTARQPEENGNG